MCLSYRSINWLTRKYIWSSLVAQTWVMIWFSVSRW
jgi:hypothetical protein